MSRTLDVWASSVAPVAIAAKYMMLLVRVWLHGGNLYSYNWIMLVMLRLSCVCTLSYSYQICCLEILILLLIRLHITWALQSAPSELSAASLTYLLHPVHSSDACTEIFKSLLWVFASINRYHIQLGWICMQLSVAEKINFSALTLSVINIFQCFTFIKTSVYFRRCMFSSVAGGD